MLKTNLRGQIRQTNLPKWKPLLPLFEAIMNALQAVHEKPQSSGRIVVSIDRQGLALDEAPPIYSFTVQDNGAGFTDENFDSFNTAFSDYKLSRGGKGLGRFTWLKAFEQVEIESTFIDEQDGALERSFVFDENYDPDDAVARPTSTLYSGSKVRLKGYREPYLSVCPRTAEQIAQKIIEHFLLVFLQPDCPAIELHDLTEKISLNEMFQRDFKAQASAHSFDLHGAKFTLHGFRLTAPRSSRHRLIYAANERAVTSENLAEHIPNLTERLVDIQTADSFVYLAVVQGSYLNQHVNNARTGFDISNPDDADQQVSLFTEEIRASEILQECLKLVEADLQDVIETLNAAKEERVERYVQEDAPHYKVLLKRKREFINKISPSATKAEIESALHQELYQREVTLKREGGKILTEASRLDSYDDYRVRLALFMEEYNELGVSNLAQYVMHRRIIIDLLDRAIKLDKASKKYPLERVVHDIVFPMRSSSDDVLYSQQNLWLIDEQLNYHTFIASDENLKKIEHIENESLKRPDLFIFDRKFVLSDNDEEHPVSSITLVEFKRPQRDDYSASDNPFDQVLDAVEDIRSGRFKDRGGRPISVSNDKIPATCFVVCDITPTLKKILAQRDAKLTPDGQGYYGYHQNGHMYFEFMDYGKMLRRAKQRNRVLFDKLNVAAAI